MAIDRKQIKELPKGKRVYDDADERDFVYPDEKYTPKPDSKDMSAKTEPPTHSEAAIARLQKKYGMDRKEAIAHLGRWS